jgi:hypothetical protein
MPCDAEPMSTWAKRDDARKGVVFISHSASAVHVVLPPGSPPTAAPVSGVRGEGLWQYATWTLDEEPLIDRDPPHAACRVPTRFVVHLLGPEHRNDVVEVMRGQLEQVWMVLTPAAGQPVEDRRTRLHGGLLMTLTHESREAFPGEGFWRLDLPDGYTNLPDEPWPQVFGRQRVGWPRFEEEPAFGWWVLVRAVLRATYKRVLGQPGIRPSDLTVWADAREWTCRVAEPVGVESAARPEHERAVISA